MKRESLNIIKLTKEQEEHIKDEIKAFYLDERGEEIGIIEQNQIVDLFMENLAPIIYNKALDDSRRWIQSQMDNLDSEYYTLYKEI